MNQHALENFTLVAKPRPIVVLAKSLAHSPNEFTVYANAHDFKEVEHKVHADDVSWIYRAFFESNSPVYVCAVPESAEDKLTIFKKLCELDAIFKPHSPVAQSLAVDWLNFIDTYKPKTQAYMLAY